jgi:hypothetical protein
MLTFAFVALTALGCNKEEKKVGGDQPPPPPTSSASPTAGGGPCANGGGENKDPVSSAYFPRKSGAYCLDPEGEVKTYGEKGKLSMDEVCTKAFDGECEVYKRFGLKRVVTLRYVDGSGAPSSVEVVLSQFPDAGGAYGMFTKRVVADGDPANASTKPFPAGAAAAMGKSNAYVWKGPYLAELTFVTEDTKATADQIAAWSKTSIGSIAKEIGDKLPGPADQLPPVKALPQTNLIPLGVSFQPKDALGVTGLGPAAVGFYKDGDKRYRMVSMVLDDEGRAKEAMIALRKRPGSMPVKDIGDEGAAVVIQEGPDRPKVEYVFARKGQAVIGVGDEDLTASDTKATKLSKDEKVSKLKAWAANVSGTGPASTGATPAASASATASQKK